MDSAYQNWLWLLLLGAFVGLFIKPRTVVKVAFVLEGIAVAGLAVSAAFSANRQAWVFGLAAMAMPVVAAVAAVGALLGSGIRSAFTHRAQK